MLRNGRAEDQEFSSTERMYRRYVQDDFEGESFKPARFRFPPSLNRERYSHPEDVIFSEDGEFDGCGILECTVGELSIRIADDRYVEYQFVPVHMPEENNYSHSEIWADCIQTQVRTDEPSKIAKKKYRTAISKLLRVRTPATK
jgi:hypothetical protein